MSKQRELPRSTRFAQDALPAGQRRQREQGINIEAVAMAAATENTRFDQDALPAGQRPRKRCKQRELV